MSIPQSSEQQSKSGANQLVNEAGVNNFVALVGSRVRKARLQCGFSRRVLSELSGVSQRYLAQLEAGTGNISITVLYRIAVALDYSPNWFLEEYDLQDPQLHKLIKFFNQASSDDRQTAVAMLETAASAADKANRLCLIGLRGAGKSTLGRLLAERRSAEFLELNQIIEDLAGMPISEIIALYGQEGYRRLEGQALESVIKSRDFVILAVSGGIVSEPETYNQLLSAFNTVWLKASPDEHMDRVRKQGDIRPMAGNPKAMDQLRSILLERENLYSRADAMVDTSGKSVDEALTDLSGVFPVGGPAPSTGEKGLA